MRKQNLSSVSPGLLLALIRCLYITNQRTKAKMDPSVARTTKIHSVGLSGIPGSTRGVWAMDLNWTSATNSTSEGKRPPNKIKYLQNMRGGGVITSPAALSICESVDTSNNRS